MWDLWRHLQFLPHGERLLTSSASFWFFSARILVFAMAASEAVAWAYLGFLFGEGATRIVAATFTGVVIFLVVWMIDVSLVTLDRAWSEHSIDILGCHPTTHQSRKAREAFTLTLRIGLLLGSLTVTAPYLSQLVFYKDIERFIEVESTKALDLGRAEITQRFARLIASKDREVETKRLEYEREVAGKGLSGRYGRGPAAEAMLTSVSTLEMERDELVREKQKALEQFDTLSANWRANRQTLAAIYNLVLPRSTILENRRAQEELRKRPENQSTEFAIKAFLAFIFAGLLLLKLFEPSSVRLYLSEVLQQEYSRYLAGSFDSVLAAPERSTSNSGAMPPQRLHEFLLKTWAPARRLEEQLAYSQAGAAVAGQSLDTLETMRQRVERDVAAANGEVARFRSDADEASRSLTELQSAIEAVRIDEEFFRAELAALDTEQAQLDGKSRLVYEKTRLGYQDSISQKLIEAERALRDLCESVPVETEKLRRADAALKEAETKLQDRERELSETERQLRSVRELLANSAEDRARSLLNTNRKLA